MIGSFADLICNCLARRGCEKDGLLPRGGAIDGDDLFQIIGSLIDGEFSDGELDVHFSAQSSQVHQVGIQSIGVRPAILRFSLASSEQSIAKKQIELLSSAHGNCLGKLGI